MIYLTSSNLQPPNDVISEPKVCQSVPVTFSSDHRSPFINLYDNVFSTIGKTHAYLPEIIFIFLLRTLYRLMMDVLGRGEEVDSYSIFTMLAPSPYNITPTPKI